MRCRSFLAALSFSVLLGLGACDPDGVAAVAGPDAGTGGVTFRLSSADSLAVAGTVDSVQVEAVSVGGTIHARGAFGSPLTLSGLPAGPAPVTA